MLRPEQIRSTGAWIAAQQDPSGEIPWWRGGKMDPWDHAHAAMGLTVAGFLPEAVAAYRFLAETQGAAGGWPAGRMAGETTDATYESNHAAYFATGVWHYICATHNMPVARELWPAVERAIEFTLGFQDESGAFAWAMAPSGDVWWAPLLTGSSSIHGSLVCAIRIAEHLGHPRPRWRTAAGRLANLLQSHIERFDAAGLPETPGRYSMDWYYPVLGGALRGAQGRRRLLDRGMIDRFIAEGVGCRCVSDAPWYTVAESSELVLALDACGLVHRAQQMLSWMRPFRMDDGGYRTGKTHPEGVFWPIESNAWTAAAVIIADDALARRSQTSGFFRSLAGNGLVQPGRAIAF